MFSGEYATSIYVCTGVAVILAIVSTMPALTSGGERGNSSEVFRAKMTAEHGYCEGNLTDVDCACFAEKSAHVLANEQPEARGFNYVQRTALARSQARDSC